MKEKNKIKLCLILFICVFFSCQNKNTLKHTQNIKNDKIKEQIKLIEDFNFDNHLDTLKVLMRDSINSDLVVCFFGNKHSVISKKAIFPKGELYSEESLNNVDFVYDKRTIIFSQEYGSASPEGWYICYINYNIKSKELVVDSISNRWKNFNAKTDADFIKSKTKSIKVNLKDFNAQTEFYNLK